jgi:hypothetical protein
MSYTYTLYADGPISPFFVNAKEEIIAIVREPRRLVIEKYDLVLIPDRHNPDLPVGSEVKVWMHRNFHCETLASLQAKENAILIKRAQILEHENQVKIHTELTVLKPIKDLIATRPAKDKLKRELSILKVAIVEQNEIYRRYWVGRTTEEKQKSNDALVVVNVLVLAISEIAKHLANRLAEQGIVSKTAYAYSPGEGARSGLYSPGKYHLQLESEIKTGRIKRVIGDVLCKPKNRFWDLTALDNDHHVNCHGCLDKMISILEG